MKHAVFIQTNHKQIVGAIVAEHALRRYSTHNDKFDVPSSTATTIRSLPRAKGRSICATGSGAPGSTTICNPLPRRG